jgi:small-conductance mechanosensitive channel
MRRAHFEPALTSLLLDSIYKVVVYGFGLVMAASQLGIDVTAALTGIGVAGIAVGFAAQDTIANMIAGFMIFWDKPFRVHDWVKVADQYGEVKEITLRTTRIRTLDNTYVVIPNRKIIGDTLVNHSMYGATRVVVKIGIAYKEKVAAARAVLVPVISTVNGVLADPPPDVIARTLGDSSVNLEVRVWIDDPALERPVGARVVEVCKVALDEAGIEIPFPHLQLFLENVDDRVWKQAADVLGRPRGES